MLCTSVLAAAVCPYDSEIRASLDDLRNQRYSEAEQKLTALAAKSPACDPDEYRLLTIALLHLNRPEDAIAAAQQGAVQFPHFEPAQAYFVSVVDSVAPRPQAAVILQHAMSLLPQSFVLKRAFAADVIQMKADDRNAGELLAECIRHDPKDVESRGFYALYLFAIHHEQESDQELNEALRLTTSPPVEVDLYRTRAVLHDKKNDVDGADAAFKKGIAINSRLKDPKWDIDLEYCDFLLRQGNATAALSIASMVAERAPALGKTHFALARALAANHQLNKALDEGKRALDLTPAESDQRPIRVSLSKWYHIAGHDDDATLQEQWLEAHQLPAQ